MGTRVCEQPADRPLGQFAGPLVSFEHNLDFRARLDVVAASTVRRCSRGHGASAVSDAGNVNYSSAGKTLACAAGEGEHLKGDA